MLVSFSVRKSLMRKRESDLKNGISPMWPVAGFSNSFSKSSGGDFGDITPHGSAIEVPEAEAQFVKTEGKKSGLIIYINSDSVAGQDTALGRSLMHQFLHTLTDIAPLPRAIILVNTAVRLAQPGSVALESLSLMHEQKVKILVCEKSIREIEGEKNVAVGEAATMYTILHTLLNAEKIISP
jgi:hypothetical protein